MMLTIELVSMEAGKNHRMAGEHSELAGSVCVLKRKPLAMVTRSLWAF